MIDLYTRSKLELGIHLALFSFMLWLGLQVSGKIYFYTFFGLLFAFFHVHTFILIPRFFYRARYRMYFVYFMMVFSISYALIWASTVQHYTSNGMSFTQIAIRYLFVRTETLFTLLGLTAFSTLYAYIRQLVLKKNYVQLKRFTKISVLILISIILLVAGKYFLDVSWSGGETVHFVNNDEIENLEELLELAPFRNKVVYIDFWSSTCGPCRRGFNNIPVIKEHFKGQEIVYLYLAHETSLPHDRQRWKNVIRDFALTGWHVYMSETFDKNIWKIITEKTDISARYPHYLLVDRKGVVQSYNSPRPGEKEAIITQIEQLL